MYHEYEKKKPESIALENNYDYVLNYFFFLYLKAQLN